MGQQQLLLLVLSIVIVGLAVVAGIQAFGENRKQAQLDAATARAIEVAAATAAYYHKPDMMGGNGRDSDMSAPLSLNALGIEQTSSNANMSRLDRDGMRLQLNVNNSARPFVIIHPIPIVEGSRRLELALWGPRQDCYARRVRERVDGSWTVLSGSVRRPSGCSW